MPTFLLVAMVLGAAAMAWFYVGLMRVHSGRAKNVIEGMTPRRVRNRRLLREIHERNGR